MSIINSLSKIADLILSGIESANWELIAQGYYDLTGKNVDIPEQDVDDTNRMLAKMMDRLDKLENGKKTKKKQTNDSKNFSVDSDRPSRKISQRRRENKFETMQDVLIEAEKERGFDKIDDNIKPTARARKQYTPKSVQCSECSSLNQVNPLFARENYICDKCIQRRGR